MPLQKKLLDRVFGKLEGGEFVDLPDEAHVSSKGGLWIEADNLYDEVAFAREVRLADEFYAAEEGSQSAS